MAMLFRAVHTWCLRVSDSKQFSLSRRICCIVFLQRKMSPLQHNVYQRPSVLLWEWTSLCWYCQKVCLCYCVVIRLLHGTSYAIPRPPIPASNSPAPVPLPPVWVPLPSRSRTFVSRSRPGPADRAIAITPWLVKFCDTHCWQVSEQWGCCLLTVETQSCLVAVLGQSRCCQYEMVRVTNGNLTTVVGQQIGPLQSVVYLYRM